MGKARRYMGGVLPASLSWLRLLVAVQGLLVLLTACDRADRPQSSAQAVVRVGYFPNLTHAQAVLGIGSGDFERAVAPATLRAQVFNAGPALVEALFAGQIDVAYVGPGPALTAHARSRGRALRIIAGAAANGVVLVARKDAGIVSLADLRGRRVATPQLGNTQDISARHFLAAALGEDAVDVMPVANAEQAALMRRGQIDAAWVPEPWASRLIVQQGAVPIVEEAALWPEGAFTLTVMVTTPEFMRRHPELLRRLLEVHHRWTLKLNENPQGCLGPLDDALFASTGKRLPAGVLPMALGRIRFTDEPMISSLRAYADWSYELGQAKRPIDIAGLVDLRLLRSVIAPDRPDGRELEHDP